MPSLVPRPIASAMGLGYNIAPALFDSLVTSDETIHLVQPGNEAYAILLHLNKNGHT